MSLTRAFPAIYPVALTPPVHSPQMSAATAPITYAPPILWVAARALNLFALFGDPSAIAAQYTHRRSVPRTKPSPPRGGEGRVRGRRGSQRARAQRKIQNASAPPSPCPLPQMRERVQSGARVERGQPHALSPAPNPKSRTTSTRRKKSIRPTSNPAHTPLTAARRGPVGSTVQPMRCGVIEREGAVRSFRHYRRERGAMPRGASRSGALHFFQTIGSDRANTEARGRAA